METLEWKELVEELKRQWGAMWLERIDDKVRAEGIANKDYEKLFVERGLVIVATRKFKPLSFSEVLERHRPSDVVDAFPPNPSVGGWGKFIRNVLRGQKRFTKKARPVPFERKEKQQLKKNGRGWLHL